MILYVLQDRLIGLHYSNLEYLAFNAVAAQDLIFECLHRGVFYRPCEELQDGFLSADLTAPQIFLTGSDRGLGLEDLAGQIIGKLDSDSQVFGFFGHAGRQSKGQPIIAPCQRMAPHFLDLFGR